MAKIELALTSTAVDGDYGIVDIYYNGNIVESNLQLSAAPMVVTHDVVPENGFCTVRVDLLNDKATDVNLNGTYSDPEDELMDVRIISAKYADDDVTFVVMIPHDGIIEYDTAGYPVYTPPAEYLSVWGREYSRTFPTSRYIP